MCLCAACNAQTIVKKNVDGNYVLKPDSFTGRYFINEKNTKYPVYITSKGKMYYWSESKKTGKLYRRYIKL
jgi:hypothetical protein